MILPKGPSGPFLCFKDFKNSLDKFPGEPHYIVFSIPYLFS